MNRQVHDTIEPVQRSAWKTLLAWFILLPLIVEGGLWGLGYRPYRQVPFTIASQPAFCFLPDPMMGFALHPGTFSVTINEGLHYTATHGADSLRITGPGDAGTGVQRPQLLLMGCSYTYGMGVTDSATFAWQLQQAMPQWQVKNMGVPGFGTVQSWLQLQRLIANGKVPTTVVLHYAAFHDVRNALSPVYRKSLYMGYERSHPSLKAAMRETKMPYIVAMDSGFQFQRIAWTEMYHNWPLREYSASMNHLQELSDQFAARRLVPENTSLYLIREMQTLCQEQGIRFVVAGLTDTPGTRQRLAQLQGTGIETLDMALDLQRPEYNHLPFDEHPNEKAHRWYAMRLYQFLSTGN